MKLKDKIVLITGSSRGIGKAIALLFAKEGAKVIINYRKSEKEANELLKKVGKISGSIALKCDVSNENQVKKMFEKILQKFGRLDVLVNNAGAYIDGDDWNGSAEIWEETLRQNLISAMNTSKYASEIFQKQKEGVIVNIASRFSISGRHDALAYSASKAGMVSITQAYATLLSPFGRANAISPGATKSGYWLRSTKEELEITTSAAPLKRLIEPEEIANIALFLASEDSRTITGQNFLADGGKS